MPNKDPIPLSRPKPPIGTALYCHRLADGEFQTWPATVVGIKGLYITLDTGERFHHIDDRLPHERGWRVHGIYITFTQHPPGIVSWASPVPRQPHQTLIAPPQSDPPRILTTDDWFNIARCALMRESLLPASMRGREVRSFLAAQNRSVALLLADQP